MNIRLSDILRNLFLATVLLVGSMFALKHYRIYQQKEEIVTELQGLTSDSSFYRQFEVKGAKEALLRSVALVHEADTLGLTQIELLDRMFQRNQSAFGESETKNGDYPLKEKLVRNTLTNAYDAAKRLEILDTISMQDLKEGRMPVTSMGAPVILPLIDPRISPGLEKIIPNLEILPADRAGKQRRLTSIEIAAARNLARDLSYAGLIESNVADNIINHYETPKQERKKN